MFAKLGLDDHVVPSYPKVLCSPLFAADLPINKIASVCEAPDALQPELATIIALPVVQSVPSYSSVAAEYALPPGIYPLAITPAVCIPKPDKLFRAVFMFSPAVQEEPLYS